jgi:hypothetical protein
VIGKPAALPTQPASSNPSTKICVAIELLRQKLTAHFTLVYEPPVTLTGQSIDVLLSYGDQRHYFDVKTVFAP